MPTVISDPRPSQRCRNWDFIYYDRKTTRGGNCLALISPALRDIVKRGYSFHDDQLQFDDVLRSWILSVDFDEPQPRDPAIPDHSETGWHDPDYPSELANPSALEQVRNHLNTVIAQPAAEPTTEHNLEPALDPSLKRLIDQVTLAYAYTAKRLGVSERARAMECQKILVTCLIPYLRERGINLSEDDEKAMSF